MAQINTLRRRMIEDMTIRNLSPATQQKSTHKHGASANNLGSVYETYARLTIAAARQARDEGCGASLMP